MKMNDFKKEIIPLAIYIAIVLFLTLISGILNTDATRAFALTALYLSLSNLVNKESR